jgi:predicted nucleic acid-binding protein
MKADFAVVLDACVLANISVCDLLLRLAETPRLYLPYWSEIILDETQRAHAKFGWEIRISDRWRAMVTKHFPDSSAVSLNLAVCPDGVDPKDAHVVQAALRVGAEVIVTFNLKDFPSESLEPARIKAVHPSEFLLTLFAIAPMLVARRINEIAEARKESVSAVLKRLSRHVPAFVDHFATSAGIGLDE